MLQDISKVLWEASQAKLACRITLTGEPFPRVVHPYGICKTSGNKIVLVCQQVAGFTKGGGKAGYRNLNFRRIVNVETLEDHFETVEDFNPEDAQYGEWVFHI